MSSVTITETRKQERHEEVNDGKQKSSDDKKEKFKIIWPNLIMIGYIHFAGVYGLYLAATKAKFLTLLFSLVLFTIGKIGMSAGVHRLWSHRSYKANLFLRTMLMIFFTIAFEGTIYSWARDHRLHHKYQDTNADPYNIQRGFIYAHIGWLFRNKDPEVKVKGKGLDYFDLNDDQVVMFQKKHINTLIILLCIMMPILVPWYFWGESLSTAWYVAACLRICLSLNFTFAVNSFAHTFGNKPYEVSIQATQNKIVDIIAFGEGWHNYHHVFPWDYRHSEIYGHSITTKFIDLMAKFGWAYDLKTASSDLVRKRALKTGDGTYKDIWGLDDKDAQQEDKEGVIVVTNKQL